jgi:hypothetical protein
MEKQFEADVFISGFFGNAILAAGLAYIGDRWMSPSIFAPYLYSVTGCLITSPKYEDIFLGCFEKNLIYRKSTDK